MVILCLGYLLGTFITKSVRAFLDPHPPTTPTLCDLVPIPQTRCRCIHNNWPPTQTSENPPNGAIVRPVQVVRPIQVVRPVQVVRPFTDG